MQDESAKESARVEKRGGSAEAGPLHHNGAGDSDRIRATRTHPLRQ